MGGGAHLCISMYHVSEDNIQHFNDLFSQTCSKYYPGHHSTTIYFFDFWFWRGVGAEVPIVIRYITFLGTLFNIILHTRTNFVLKSHRGLGGTIKGRIASINKQITHGKIKIHGQRWVTKTTIYMYSKQYTDKYNTKF